MWIRTIRTKYERPGDSASGVTNDRADRTMFGGYNCAAMTNDSFLTHLLWGDVLPRHAMRKSLPMDIGDLEM